MVELRLLGAHTHHHDYHRHHPHGLAFNATPRVYLSRSTALACTDAYPGHLRRCLTLTINRSPSSLWLPRTHVNRTTAQRFIATTLSTEKKKKKKEKDSLPSPERKKKKRRLLIGSRKELKAAVDRNCKKKDGKWISSQRCKQTRGPRIRLRILCACVFALFAILWEICPSLCFTATYRPDYIITESSWPCMKTNTHGIMCCCNNMCIIIFINNCLYM